MFSSLVMSYVEQSKNFRSGPGRGGSVSLASLIEVLRGGATELTPL